MAAPRRRPRILAPLALLLAVLLVAPFGAELGQAGLADWSGVDVPGLFQAGIVSVTSATLATALVALGGIPLGYLLARTPGRGMALLGFVVQLPLALPPLASGILLLFLLGYASPLGRLTHGALTDSFLGIVLAETFVAAPFLIVAARSAFAEVDPVLEDVAATLGHRPGAVFRRVSLALAFLGIWAGLLLTWLRAFGEFGATVMVAYHPYSLPVYTYVAFGSEGLPAMLPILLPTIVIAVGAMALSLRAGRAPSSRYLRSTPPLPVTETTLPRPITVPGRALHFAFLRRQDSFTLDVAWQTEARRLCILGGSGSGKSATLRLLAGLDRADTALLTFAGHDLAATPPHARAIGYVPQNYGLLPNLTVAQQIRFGVTADLRAPKNGPGVLAWPGWSIGYPRNCRSGSSNGCRWPVPCPAGRPCCCSTSRSPPWMPRCGRGCARSCWLCRGRSRRPQSWSPMTRQKPRCWPMTFYCCRMGACCNPVPSRTCSAALPARQRRGCSARRMPRQGRLSRRTRSMSAAFASPLPGRHWRAAPSAGPSGRRQYASTGSTACRLHCYLPVRFAPGNDG